MTNPVVRRIQDWNFTWEIHTGLYMLEWWEKCMFSECSLALTTSAKSVESTNPNSLLRRWHSCSRHWIDRVLYLCICVAYVRCR